MRKLGRLPLLAALATLACSVALAEERVVDIRQGTNLALTLSPDGQTLVIDLRGQLWTLPVSGGAASPLTPADEAARNPRFRPDGQAIVYQRWVDRQWDVWELDLATGSRRAVTGPPYDEREPEYTHDGRAILFTADRSGRSELWALDQIDDGLRRLTWEPGEKSYPSASPFGEIAYVSRQSGRWSLNVLTANGEEVELLTTRAPLAAPSWRPAGGLLVFNQRDDAASNLRMLLLGERPVVKTLTRAEDVFHTRPAWSSSGEFFYAADGQIWRRGLALATRYPVQLFAAVTVETDSAEKPSIALGAEGPQPVRGIVGKTTSADGERTAFTALGDLWISDDGDPPRQLTNDPFVDIDPAFTPDGKAIVFASDRGGNLDLWKLTLDDGQVVQLTRSESKSYRPIVAPVGERVAFLETDDAGPWGTSVLRLLELDRPGQVQTLATDLENAGAPQWEADGMALLVTVGADNRPRRLRIALGGGQPNVSEEAPSGAASPTEARLPELGAADEEKAVALEWIAAVEAEPYVVRVGRLFDGIGGHYRRHVDVHMRGERIEAIVSRGELPLPPKVIDALDYAVMPGFIDLHAHQSALSGEPLGRTWLAHGITTVREIGDDVEEAMERAEAWASGRRLGPRAAPYPREITGGPPVDTLVHAISRQNAMLGFPPLAAPPWHRALPSIAVAHGLEVSPLLLSYQDVFSILTASGTVLIPTLAALDERLPAGGLLAGPPANAGRRSIPAAAPAAAAGATVGPVEDMVLRFLRGGGRVAIGSDAPAVAYGLGLHAELERLSRAGVPNDQVLRLATAEGALALGLDAEIGTLEPGKLADFVVVTGDPLARIADTLSIVAVVKGGRWLDRQALLAGP